MISLPIVDFLLSALALQGLILSFLLLYSSRKVRANRWIGLLILAVSVMIINQELDYSGVWNRNLWLLNFICPFSMALGPLVYFYSRSVMRQTQKSYLHFLPVLIDLKRQIIFLLYITGVLAVPFIQQFYFLAQTQRVLLGNNLYQVLPGFVSCCIYGALTYRFADKYSRSKEISAEQSAEIGKLKTLLQMVAILLGIWLFTIIADFSHPEAPVHLWTHYLLSLPAIVFIYWLGMATYLARNAPAQIVPQVNANIKPVKVHFTQLKAKEHFQNLHQLMQSEKLYLNPVLKLETVAGKLKLPEKLVSSLLNQHMSQNFNDFVNGYRVEEAKRKLIDPANSPYTISAIALDCGFNSLATFQRAFKQLTGTTPSSYQNSHDAISSAANPTQIQI